MQITTMVLLACVLSEEKSKALLLLLINVFSVYCVSVCVCVRLAQFLVPFGQFTLCAIS